MTLSSTARQIIFWLLIVAGALLLYKLVNPSGKNAQPIDLATLVQKIDQQEIKQLVFKQNEAIAQDSSIVGYEDELVGNLADRMAESDTGRVPILRRGDDAVIGLVARRDLLRVRSTAMRHERDREALIQLGKRGPRKPA